MYKVSIPFTLYVLYAMEIYFVDITLKCYIVLQARIAALTELLPDLGGSVRM